MSLSRRSSDAPLLGTEEEGSMTRLLTTAVQDFDGYRKVQRKYETRQQLLGRRPKLAKTHLGAYLPIEEEVIQNDRQKLFSRLSENKAIDEKDTKISSVVGSVSADIRSEAAEILNNRRMFAPSELLPPPKLMSELQTLSITMKAAEAEDKLNHNLAEPRHSSTAYVAKDQDQDDAGFQKKYEAPAKEVVKYGNGRLRSTHAYKVPLESPWSTVSSKYNIHSLAL